MAGTPGQLPALAERTDIYKSCKSFEVLLNLLNDYCSAVSTSIQLQKRLAKAIRETASLKTTEEIPSNVLAGCATIFEALSDVDAKFSKFADREYDTVSTEIKKWFKKLAKEEKAHDEKIKVANNRIKAAAQQYEKKSKKNPHEGAEEHAKYMNLISTLGPEVSEQKYDHALFVTQRHSAATYSVASTLGRIADGEWLRACENVKQVAPTIGTMGEWRAFCDGGWTANLPQGLPTYDDAGFEAGPGGLTPGAQTLMAPSSGAMTPSTPGEEMHLDVPGETTTIMRSVSSQDDLSREQSLNSAQPSPNSSPQPPHQSFNKPPPTSFDPIHKLQSMDTGSVRTLSAFPTPPTHFPIPNMGARSPLSEGIVIGSPARETHGDRSDKGMSSVSFPSSQDLSASHEHGGAENGEPRRVTDSPEPVVQDAVQAAPQLPPLKASGDMEFGVLSKGAARSGAGDSPVGTRGTLERNDTGASSESFVAAMRNRYSGSHAAPPSSPPPKVHHRSTNSVTDLASRFEPLENSSPTTSLQRERPLSPGMSRRTSLPPIDDRIPQSPTSPARTAQYRSTSGTSSNAAHAPRSPITTSVPEEPAGHNLGDRRALELAERERKLEEMERTIRQRERELEVGKAELMDRYNSVQEDPSPPQAQLSRPRHTSFQHQQTSRPMPYTAQSSASTGMSSAANRQSYAGRTSDSQHLLPNANSNSNNTRASQSSSSQDSRSASSSAMGIGMANVNDHAPSCGCASCSVQKYARVGQASSYDLRPPEKPISLRPEKPKGWIRRLSMDVGNAFSSSSSDSKKGISSAAYGIVPKSPVSGGGVGGGVGGLLSLDGKRNASVTGFQRYGPGGAGVGEDGRMGALSRRSYDSGGDRNRSMTNLGRPGR